MARALKNPIEDPTYLDFFGMKQPPFAPLSGPSQIFHSDQYSLLMTHLAGITEQSDCLMVICGADGSGKTTLLNRYTTSLGQDVSFATFDETCVDGNQFYCAFLRQLGFQDISGSLQELRRITKEFLIHRGIAGDPVLVIIDNAHLVSPSVFEQLRWIAETKVEETRVLSIVLAGNSDLPRIMDSPAMRMLKFRSHIDFTIRVYTEEETEDYVRHRLRLAGGADAAKFSVEARQLIYRFTGGTPSLINMLCNEVLTEGCAQKTRVITDELVRAVADSHQLVPHVVPLQGKGRRSTDPDIKFAIPEQLTEERITAREVSPKQPVESPTPDPVLPDVDAKKLLEQISGLSEQLGELNAGRKRARKDVRSRDKQIDKLKEQLSSLKDEQKQGQLEINERDKELSTFEERLGVVQTERDQARQNVGSRDKALRELEEQLDEFQLEREQAKREISARDKNLDELKEQLDVFQSDREQAQQDIGARDKNLDELKEQLDALQSDREQAQQDIGARDKNLDELKEQLDVLQSEREQAQQDVSTRNKDLDELKEQLDALQSEREQAQQDIGSRDKDLGDLREQLDALQSEREQAQQDISARDTELRDFNEQLDALHAEREQAQQDISARDKELESLREQQDTLQAEREQAHLDITTRDEDLNELKELLESQAKETEMLVGSVGDRAGEIRRLNKALVKNEKALQKSEEKSTKLAADLKEEKGTAKRANVDVDKAKKKIEELDLVKSQLQSKVSDLSADLKDAHKQAKEIESLDENEKAIKQELDDMSEQLLEREEELASLETSVKESREECESLKSSNEEKKDLMQSVAEKESRIADLEAELAAQKDEIAEAKELLAGEQTASRAQLSISDAEAAQPLRAITSIEVTRRGKVEQLMQIEQGLSRIMIGRSDDSELQLDSKYVSRHHALILLTDEGAFIEDLNSFNGTTVNSKSITRCSLHPNDKVTVGDFKLRPFQA
ncbi:MAG: FHA domain-containing protein [Gammaproteobacteria bacterium]|nr:FHA domain-containing protein [Gammaproteobacteria bacterium]